MKATIISQHSIGDLIEVKVANDPFTSMVEIDRLNRPTKTKEHKMPTATKQTVKELRLAAKKAQIEGWDEMDRDELVAALAELDGADDDEEESEEEDTEDEDDEEEVPVKKSKSAKKAPASKKAVAKKSTPAKKAATSKKAASKAKADDDDEAESGPNPFRPQSNLWHFTEALMKGGKRSALVARLERKVELKPRVRGGRDYSIPEEIDYRLVRVCQELTNNHGFVIEKDGRGTEQKVKAIPPEDQ